MPRTPLLAFLALLASAAAVLPVHAGGSRVLAATGVAADSAVTPAASQTWYLNVALTIAGPCTNAALVEADIETKLQNAVLADIKAQTKDTKAKKVKSGGCKDVNVVGVMTGSC